MIRMGRLVTTFILITIFTFFKLSSAGSLFEAEDTEAETFLEESEMDAGERGMDAEDRGRECGPCCKACEKHCEDDYESLKCKRCFKKKEGCKKCRKPCIQASDKCMPGYMRFEFKVNNDKKVKRCYYFSTDEELFQNFTEARDQCKGMFPYPFKSVDLATPTTSEEFNFVGYNIEHLYPNRVDYNFTTLGAQASDDDGQFDAAFWSWINGETTPSLIEGKNPPVGPWIYNFPNSMDFTGLCGAYYTSNDTFINPGSGMVNIPCNPMDGDLPYNFGNPYVCQYNLN